MIKDILKRAAYLMLATVLVVTSVPIPVAASSQTVLDADGGHGNGDNGTDNSGTGGSSGTGNNNQNDTIVENEDKSNSILSDITYDEPEYHYDSQNDKGGKKVTFSASVSYNFEGTNQTPPQNPDDNGTGGRNGADNDSKKAPWEGYYAVLSLEVVRWDSEGNEKKETIVLDTVNYDSANKSVNLSGSHKFYEYAEITAVLEVKNASGTVTTKDAENVVSTVSKTSQMQKIEMPQQVSASFSSMTNTFDGLSRSTEKNKEEGPYYYASLTSAITIEITTDSNYTKEQQLEAIKDAVNVLITGKKFEICENEKAEIDISEALAICDDKENFGEKIKEKTDCAGTYTYELARTDYVKVENAGDYKYKCAITETVNDEKTSVIEKLVDVSVSTITPQFNYVRKEQNPANPVFGQTITYVLEAGATNLYGEFDCYEIDENNNRIKPEDSNLKIDTSIEGQISITCNKLGEHKVIAVYYAVGVCEEKSQTITFDVEKAPLEGRVSVTSKYISSNDNKLTITEDAECIEKWKNIEIVTTLTELNGSALDYQGNKFYEDLEIEYYLISDKSDMSGLSLDVYSEEPVYNEKTNTVTYRATLLKSTVESLKLDETYRIEAEVTFDDDNPYHLEGTTDTTNTTGTINSVGTYSALNENLLLELNGNEQNLNLTLKLKQKATVNYTVTGNETGQVLGANDIGTWINKNQQGDSVNYTETGFGTIDITAVKAGVTELTIIADDQNREEPMPDGLLGKTDRYNEAVRTITFTVPIPEGKYTINGMDAEKFLESIEINENEHWTNRPITIQIEEGSDYTQIQYRELGSNVWKKTEGKAWKIEESELTSYEFRLIDEESEIYSDQYEVNGIKRGTEKLPNVGVDMSKPVIPSDLYTNNAPTGSSNDTISYFSDDVNIIAANIRDYGAIVDEKATVGSGIKAIYVKYNDDEEWSELDFKEENRNKTFNYELALNESKQYGTIQMKVADYVGNESEVVYYKGAYQVNGKPENSKEKLVGICVDKEHPTVAVTPYIYDTSEKTYVAYDGNWTNQQLKYEVALSKKSVSGVASYEYVFVPRGQTLEDVKDQWQTLDLVVNGNQVTASKIFGAIKKASKQEETAGTIIYPDTAAPEVQEQNSEYAQMNGTLYFRATSNAGLTTQNKDLKKESEKNNQTGKKNKNQNGDIRIWQQDLEEPKVCVNEKPDAVTKWYNANGKKARVTFEYPEYNRENYAPAVGVYYELKQTALNQNNEKESTTIIKTFYKGIIDESTGKIVEVVDYTNPDEKTSLEKEGVISINSDSINQITVYNMDIAGNISDKYTYEIKADYTAPENIKILFDGEAQELHKSKKDKIAYNVFSNDKIKVTTEADCGISGEKNISLMHCKDIEEIDDLSDLKKQKSMTIEQCNRGFIYLYAEDKAGNTTKVWSDGFVTDDQTPVGQDSDVIDIIAYGANEEGYFNKDINITIKTKDAPEKDNFAGLQQVTYTVGTAEKETKTDANLYTFDEENPSWEQITESASFTNDDIIISAKENESNEAYIKVTAVDKAGNTVTEEKELKIDITCPVIEITYDKNLEDTYYYNTDRVAKIEVIETNFDPELANIIITRDGKPYEAVIEGWKTEEDVNTASITFHEDGDYTVTMECTDLAGNEAEYTQVDEFTVDQTLPVVEVSYDNTNPWKENYYNTARTATITVEEHNFDEKAFQTDITPNASISGWRHSGDTHTASITFAEDEHYTFSVNCTDLAGNEMESYTPEEFYIDTTVPEIAISGVADKSANAGDVVPVVSVKDSNYDLEGVNISVTNSKGQQINLERTVAGLEGGYAYTLSNVNEQPDEIYTLTANVTDLAGNEAELGYRFSLNRNGSTYDLSDMSALVESVYTRYVDMEDLYVLETNVDEIQNFSIYVTRNGELLTESKEGALPSAMDTNTIYYNTEVSGNEEIGYQYQYTLYRENFEQEGIYNIMFYSKDKAGNEVNNTLTEKGAEITFIVDNTAPTVVIDGVETGEFYAEDSKLVNVSVNDNFKLESALFQLVDEDGNTIQTYDYLELAEEDGDVVALTLPNSSKELSLIYSTSDMAGNNSHVTTSSKEAPTEFMISTNAWLKFINNQAAVAGVVGGAGAITAAGGSVSFFRRRRLKKLPKVGK